MIAEKLFALLLQELQIIEDDHTNAISKKITNLYLEIWEDFTFNFYIRFSAAYLKSKDLVLNARPWYSSRCFITGVTITVPEDSDK